MKWRVGRIPRELNARHYELGHLVAVYRCTLADGSVSDDDIFIGIMNDEVSASRMVARLNGEIECDCQCHRKKERDARESREAG